MKKTLLTLILTVLMLLSLTLATYASETESSVTSTDGSTTIYNDDGSYTVISAPVAIPVAQTRAATHDTAGEVSATQYSKKGEINWIYTLIGYFTYEEGVSCVSTNSTYEVSIFNNSWKFYDASNTWSENAAYGYGIFKSKFAFITTNSATIDLRIRCDNYGNFY